MNESRNVTFLLAPDLETIGLRPTCSLVITWQEPDPFPRQPLRKRGLWAFLTSANAKAEVVWRNRVDAWYASGGMATYQLHAPRAMVVDEMISGG